MRTASLLATCLLLGVAAPAPGTTQPGQPAVVEEQRVTAVDLLVELRRRRPPREVVEAPAGLTLDEFTVRRDGAPVRLLALAAPDRDDPEPWRIVIWVDRVLSSRHSVRWATAALAERAGRLTELGEVEIVAADPEPRRALAPSRDAELIDRTLSGIFLAPEARDALIARREEFLLRLAEPSPEAPPLPDPAALAHQEADLLGLQLDRLLGWTLDREPPTARKALLLISDGFDLRPADFYAAHLDRAGGVPPPADLAPRTAVLAEVLAAYGWIVVPLTPPRPPEGARRFGVGLLPPSAPGILLEMSLRSLAVWLDRNRRPKRARAYYELGLALRDGGELARAVEAFRKAVYHYYDHPKTATRQAAALVAWGETLEQQGRSARAREVFRRAVAFDGALASRYPFADARLLAPLEPLERLAEVTAGDLVGDDRALEALLASLANRVRLTYQLGGPAAGRLHEVEAVLARTAYEIRYPVAGRWGTPPAVVELRLRRLLAGALESGGLELAASLDARSRLGVRIGRAGRHDHEGPRSVRISWASRGEDPGVAYGHRVRQIDREQEEIALSLPLSLPAEHSWIAVVVEDLDSAEWGSSTLEID